MYELIQLTERAYYIQSPAKIGVYKINDSEVCIIDSGNDKEAGKKVLKVLNSNGWTLSSILVTHSNADHIGGCQYLRQQTNCKVYAPGIECDFTNHPILEPAFLYGGYPGEDLRHKFLLAKECEAEPLSADVLPDGLEILPLPGHFFDMVGFKTADGALFIADSLSSRETLDKYVIGFIYDVAAYLDTLEAKVIVPSHAAPCEDITELAQYNIDKVNEICEKIVGFCEEPINFEALLKQLFDFYGLTLNFEQYVLVGSTVRSYLAYLKDSGRLTVSFDDNMLRWIKA